MRKMNKIIASIVLTCMCALAVVPYVQAASNYSISKEGYRKKVATNLYASFTGVSIYDSKGNAVNHIVGAKYGPSEWMPAVGKGYVSAQSSALGSTSYNAQHSYGIGSDPQSMLDYQWTKN